MVNNIPNISNIAEIDYLVHDDYFIVDGLDQTYVVEFSDYIIDLDHISFADVISVNATTLLVLSAADIVNFTNAKNRLEIPDTASTYYTANSSQRLTGADFGTQEVIGIERKVPIDKIIVNTFNSQTSTTQRESCNVTLSPGTSSLVLPAGLYRAKLVATYKPFESASTNAAAWIFTKLKQLTPPETDLLVSNPAYSTNGLNTISVVNFINGYFYLCKAAEVAVMSTSNVSFVLGAGALRGNLYNELAGDLDIINSLDHAAAYPVSLVLERVGETNTLNAEI